MHTHPHTHTYTHPHPPTPTPTHTHTHTPTHTHTHTHRLVFPEVASYSNVPPNSSISSVTELGPSVRTTFVVRNSGPSPVPTVELTVMWPIDGQDTGFNTFVYPASISVSKYQLHVLCTMSGMD